MGDRIYNVFNISMLRSLSPPRGFLCRCNITRGVLRFAQAQAEYTPVCGLSSLRDFRGFRLRLSEAKKPPSTSIR